MLGALLCHSICCLPLTESRLNLTTVKHFIQHCLPFMLLLLSIAANAQFKGGNGKGNTVAFAAKAALGQNIFVGGADDGYASMMASKQTLGKNIFLGGNDDGFSAITAKTQSLGRNIFTGGDNDGFTSVTKSGQALGRNIFLGGQDDGFSAFTAKTQNLGRNIFTGGANDGWAMAFVSQASLALPVTLSEFTAKWQASDAVLHWQTSLESNTATFELLRSYDGVTFNSIHTEAAAGQSSSARNYQYTDPNIGNFLPAGVTSVYYRLKTIDIDGKFTFSGIVFLRTDRANTSSYAIYPNPARDIITISSSGSATNGRGMITLFDMGGRLLVQQKIIANHQQVSVAALPGGTYFLQLSSSGNILYTQKIIIQK